MNGSKKKAAAKNAKSVSFTKEVDNTEKIENKDYSFFKFHVDDNKEFIGSFKGILPETHPLSGIEMLPFDTETNEFAENVVLIPNYHNLIKFFKKKKVEDNIVYQIKLLEEKELEKANTVFLFEIGSADISENEE